MTIKFLHTADWHLGRVFFQMSLLEEQRHALKQIIAIAVEQQVQAVLIAGDVFDRSIAPVEAVQLLDEIMTSLICEHGIAVVMVAGNHDSEQRLAYGGRITELNGLHVRGPLGRFTPIPFEHGGVRVLLHPLPYLEPAMLRNLPGGDSINTHEEAMRYALSQLGPLQSGAQRHILLGHAFVAGSAECESERSISVGGTGAVPSSVFDGFDVVALGHLHRPQTAGAEHIRYSGSLLKYSFSEEAHNKSVNIITLAAKGAPQFEQIPLQALHDVRSISGCFVELLQAQVDVDASMDYIQAFLTDETPVLDAMQRLRQVYPNLVTIRMAVAQVGENAGALVANDLNNPEQRFLEFFHWVKGKGPNEAELQAFQAVLQAELQAEQEIQIQAERGVAP